MPFLERKKMKFNTMNSVIKLGLHKIVQALVCMERVHRDPLGHELCWLASRAYGPVSSSLASAWK